mgnify:CR=1 FL=1
MSSEGSSNGSNGSLNSAVPPGPLPEKWTTYKSKAKLINPANKRKYKVIMVGTGLGGGAASSMATGASTEDLDFVKELVEGGGKRQKKDKARAVAREQQNLLSLV